MEKKLLNTYFGRLRRKISAEPRDSLDVDNFSQYLSKKSIINHSVKYNAEKSCDVSDDISSFVAHHITRSSSGNSSKKDFSAKSIQRESTSKSIIDKTASQKDFVEIADASYVEDSDNNDEYDALAKNQIEMIVKRLSTEQISTIKKNAETIKKTNNKILTKANLNVVNDAVVDNQEIMYKKFNDRMYNTMSKENFYNSMDKMSGKNKKNARSKSFNKTKKSVNVSSWKQQDASDSVEKDESVSKNESISGKDPEKRRRSTYTIETKQIDKPKIKLDKSTTLQKEPNNMRNESVERTKSLHQSAALNKHESIEEICNKPNSTPPLNFTLELDELPFSQSNMFVSSTPNLKPSKSRRQTFNLQQVDECDDENKNKSNDEDDQIEVTLSNNNNNKTMEIKTTEQKKNPTNNKTKDTNTLNDVAKNKSNINATNRTRTKDNTHKDASSKPLDLSTSPDGDDVSNDPFDLALAALIRSKSKNRKMSLSRISYLRKSGTGDNNEGNGGDEEDEEENGGDVGDDANSAGEIENDQSEDNNNNGDNITENDGAGNIDNNVDEASDGQEENYIQMEANDANNQNDKEGYAEKLISNKNQSNKSSSKNRNSSSTNRNKKFEDFSKNRSTISNNGNSDDNDVSTKKTFLEDTRASNLDASPRLSKSDKNQTKNNQDLSTKRKNRTKSRIDMVVEEADDGETGGCVRNGEVDIQIEKEIHVEKSAANHNQSTKSAKSRNNTLRNDKSRNTTFRNISKNMNTTTNSAHYNSVIGNNDHSEVEAGKKPALIIEKAFNFNVSSRLSKSGVNLSKNNQDLSTRSRNMTKSRIDVVIEEVNNGVNIENSGVGNVDGKNRINDDGANSIGEIENDGGDDINENDVADNIKDNVDEESDNQENNDIQMEAVDDGGENDNADEQNDKESYDQELIPNQNQSNKSSSKSRYNILKNVSKNRSTISNNMNNDDNDVSTKKTFVEDTRASNLDASSRLSKSGKNQTKNNQNLSTRSRNRTKSRIDVVVEEDNDGHIEDGGVENDDNDVVNDGVDGFGDKLDTMVEGSDDDEDKVSKEQPSQKKTIVTDGIANKSIDKINKTKSTVKILKKSSHGPNKQDNSTQPTTNDTRPTKINDGSLNDLDTNNPTHDEENLNINNAKENLSHQKSDNDSINNNNNNSTVAELRKTSRPMQGGAMEAVEGTKTTRITSRDESSVNFSSYSYYALDINTSAINNKKKKIIGSEGGDEDKQNEDEDNINTNKENTTNKTTKTIEKSNSKSSNIKSTEKSNRKNVTSKSSDKTNSKSTEKTKPPRKSSTRSSRAHLYEISSKNIIDDDFRDNYKSHETDKRRSLENHTGGKKNKKSLSQGTSDKKNKRKYPGGFENDKKGISKKDKKSKLQEVLDGGDENDNDGDGCVNENDGDGNKQSGDGVNKDRALVEDDEEEDDDGNVESDGNDEPQKKKNKKNGGEKTNKKWHAYEKYKERHRSLDDEERGRPDGEAEGLRRSKRVRLHRLAGHMGERPLYVFNGYTWDIKGVIEPYYLQWAQERSERMKNHRKKPTKKATTDNDADNSDHDTQKRKRNPGEMVEDGEEMEAHVPMEGREVLDEQAQGIEVVDALTNQVKMQECFAINNQFPMMNCVTRQQATPSDPIIMNRPLQSDLINGGTLILRPLMKKKMQLIHEDLLLFHIKYGKVLVTIHRTSVVLQTNDFFYVPPGNTYAVENLRKDSANLVFFILKNYNRI